MVMTISTNPSFALPGRRTQIIVHGGSEDTQRIRIKAAPKGSKFFREDGAETTLDSTLDFQGRIGQETIVFEPDTSGRYTLIIEDTNKIPDRKPSYDGSPNQNFQESITARQEVSLYVSAKLTFEMGTGEDKATLSLYMNNSTIHGTTVAEYGEEIGVTPRLDNPQSMKAEQAIQNLGSSALLSELVGQTASEILGNIPVILDSWCGRFISHFEDTGMHQGYADTISAETTRKARGYPTSNVAVQESLNRMNAALVGHMRNDVLDSNGVNAPHPVPDFRDLTIVSGASDQVSALMLMADLYRAFAAHDVRTSAPDAHNSAGSNTLSIPGDLILIIVDYLAEIAQLSQSAFSTANPGALVLVSSAGFVSEFSGETSVT